MVELAATRLIALHKNKGKSVAACLKSRTDYAQNPDKTQQGELVSSYECSPLTVDEEFMLSKRQYELMTGRRQKNDVIAYQIRQSFKPGEITAEEANKVGYELAMRFTKGKYAFIVATHTDREHIHNHIIYNSTALDSTRKFRDFLLSGLAVQRLSDLICLEHQLSVIEIKPYRERQKRTFYPPRESNRDKLCAVIDNILLNEKPTDFEAFLQTLEQQGYEIKRGKHTSVKGTRQKRFIRFRTLGAGYSEDEIKAVIAGEAEHRPHQKQPPKEQPFHLLVDIQAKLSEGKSEGYARWAKRYNLKEISKTLIFLQENKIGSINNLDEDSFVYVKGNFEPIVSESLWHECERIRKSRISSLRLPDGETRRKGTKTTKNLWVSKLRCRCGSSYRIFKWRKLKDGTPVFGYQCNMRTVNPTRSFVLEHSLTDQLSCDAISVPEWKLDLMAKKIFEKVWGNQNKAILLACQMIEGCKSGKPTTLISAAPIQSKIEKIKNRKMNYAAMRADGELGREEYQALCKQADDEINRLEQDLKSIAPEPDSAAVSANMKALHDFLEQKLDVRGACLAPELIEQFVEVVTPISDYTYRWKLNTGSKKEKHERADLMAVTGKPVLTFTIDFETAKKYREANKMPHQFRRAAWSDLTVEVYL